MVRGGLTSKHLDVAELLAVVDTEPMPSPIQTAIGPRHRFTTPVPEFSLTRLRGPSACPVTPVGPEIILVTQGEATLRAGNGQELILLAGQAAIVSWSDGPYSLEPAGSALIWRASVGEST